MTIPEKRPIMNPDDFDRSEERGTESLPGVAPSDYLAKKTCLKIWNQIDREEEEKSAPRGKGSFSENRPMIPKFPRFERSSNKKTPFLLKKVSVFEVPEKPLRETSRILPPIDAVSFIHPPQSTETSLDPPRRTPSIITPPAVSPILTAPTETGDILPFSPERIETPVEDGTSVVKPTLTVPDIPLKDLNREFARDRAKAAKTRRRRFRSPLINGEIREELKEEYYWEILSPTSDGECPAQLFSEKKSKQGPNLLEAIFLEPIISIGHITLRAFSPLKHLAQENRGNAPLSEEMNRSYSVKEKNGRPSDVLISVIMGILIAAIFVFPLIRMTSNEIYRIIRKSNVRKIGQSVSVSNDSPNLIQLILTPQMPMEGADLTGDSSAMGREQTREEISDGPLSSPESDWGGSLLDDLESPHTEGDGAGQEE